MSRSNLRDHARFPAFTGLWHAASMPSKMAILAILTVLVSPWLGVVFALAILWLHTNTEIGATSFALFIEKYAFLVLLIPVASVGHQLITGTAVPPDDLLRHLSAWQLNYDYRAQYPWSTVPSTNLWLGFDVILGLLQQAGISKSTLLIAVPAASVSLGFCVLFASLKRAVPAHRARADLLILCGLLALSVMAPRLYLGRPEGFIMVLGAAAWLVSGRRSLIVWTLAYLVSIPFYWLGWVIAPSVLLFQPGKFRNKLLFAMVLAGVHLVYWQIYSGNYLNLLIWLQGTLADLASENAPMYSVFGHYSSWLSAVLLSLIAATELRKLSRPRGWRRVQASFPLLLLVIWFCMPNQIRYYASIILLTNPWLYRKLVCLSSLYGGRTANPARVPAVVIFALLALVTIDKLPPADWPDFALGSDARVYSEQPFVTVYKSQAGIAVEPSFARGATQPQWARLLNRGAIDCERLRAGGFTHVIEKSLTSVPTCANLAGVSKGWRLWDIK